MTNTRKKMKGRISKILFLIFFSTCFLFGSNKVFSQCQPYIKIDGNPVLANQIIAAGLSLPFWLKSGQTLAVYQMVQTISVIEFTENTETSSLEYSRVISIDASTSLAAGTVPSGKIWKVESISKTPSLSDSNGAVFSGDGTYSLVIPSCAAYICIEAWGSGGGGGGSGSTWAYGGGGGGGGYGQGCYTIAPGSTLTIVIGKAGAVGANNATGGSASAPTTVTGPGISISVAGGSGGGASANGGGVGGAGGSTITGTTIKVAGSNGVTGGAGGPAGGSPKSFGGAGGSVGDKLAVIQGQIPGGGGGGMFYSSGNYYGGAAAPGRVIVTW